MFDTLGQDETKKLFNISLKSHKIAHSYLIEGEEGLGKMNMAKYIAASLLCKSGNNGACGNCINCKKINELIHPDLKVIDEKTIKIDNIRDSIDEVYKKPYEGDRKVLIIKNFDTATVESQNAILKTLEEPPSTATIILLAKDTLSILDTIKSRCQIIKMFRVHPLLVKERLISEGIDDTKAEAAAIYSEGNIGVARKACKAEFTTLRNEIFNMAIDVFKISKFEALKYGEKLTKYKDEIDDVLNIFTSVYRDIIFLKLGQGNNRLVNRDKMEILVEESYRLSYNKLDKSLNIIKDTRNSLKRDTNFQLTMEVMILGIQEAK